MSPLDVESHRLLCSQGRQNPMRATEHLALSTEELKSKCYALPVQREGLWEGRTQVTDDRVRKFWKS